MTDELPAGSSEVLDALEIISGEPRARLDTALRAAEADTTIADVEHVVEALDAVVRRVRLAPIAFEAKAPVIEPLKRLVVSPPAVRMADIEVWRKLVKELPVRGVDVVRDPVVLPAMARPQEAAWSTILDRRRRAGLPLVAHRRPDGGADQRRTRRSPFRGRPPTGTSSSASGSIATHCARRARC